MLRLVLANARPGLRKRQREQLQALGHQVVAECGNCDQLRRVCTTVLFDLVLLDQALPDHDCWQSLASCESQRAFAIVVMTAPTKQPMAVCMEQLDVDAYLAQPFTAAAVATTLDFAMHWLQQRRRVQTEIRELRRELANRRTIDAAKQVLMKNSGLSEADAHMRLQWLSRSKNQKLIYIAEAILTADQALQLDDRADVPVAPSMAAVRLDGVAVP